MDSLGRNFFVSISSSLVPAADFHVTPPSLAVCIFEKCWEGGYVGRGVRVSMLSLLEER